MDNHGVTTTREKDNMASEPLCTDCPDHEAYMTGMACRVVRMTAGLDPEPNIKNEREGNLGEVIDRRVQVYGDPRETFVRVAEIWSGILGHHVNPVDVPLMMIGYKLLRAAVSPDYSDNIDDVDGYADIFRTLVGDDMIQARSVNDYIAQKWPEA